MSFDWKKYIDVSEHLRDNLETEASFRSGVSRAYYSVFGKAKLFCLNQLRIITPGESNSSKCHALIVDRLAAEDDEDLFELSQLIFAIKERRLEADYNPHSNRFTKDFLIQTIVKTIEIHEIIEDFKVR